MTKTKTTLQMESLFEGQIANQNRKSSIVGEDKNSRPLEVKIPSSQEDKSARDETTETTIKEVKKSRGRRSKKSRVADDKNSGLLETKNSRAITDASGRTRRPANITIADDVKEALDILAIKRRVRVWVLLDKALRAYLNSQGVNI